MYYRAFVFVVGLCCSMAASAERVHVAVASNFKTTLDALVVQFQSASQHQVRISSGSTGKLYAQILQGAPYDLFLAADQERPERLERAAMTVPQSRFTYAVGQLVLWHSDDKVIDQNVLRSARKIAIANPKLAPYGRAAQQVIQHLGLSNTLRQKLVLGENIGQTFAFVHTGNADVGLVALSQVKALPDSQQGHYWLVPPDTHDPIFQDAVVLHDTPASQAFTAFLKTRQAKRMIQTHGYLKQ